MNHYKVKVDHRRFLNREDNEKLTSFGIKVRLNNHVYHEYTSHMISEIDITDEQLNKLTTEFDTEIKDDLIIIKMNK